MTIHKLAKYNLMYCQHYLVDFPAGVAQLVEQWIEDPRVTSSNLVLGNLKVNQKIALILGQTEGLLFLQAHSVA